MKPRSGDAAAEFFSEPQEIYNLAQRVIDLTKERDKLRQEAEKLAEALEWTDKIFSEKADGIGEVAVIEQNQQALASYRKAFPKDESDE